MAPGEAPARPLAWQLGITLPGLHPRPHPLQTWLSWEGRGSPPPHPASTSDSDQRIFEIRRGLFGSGGLGAALSHCPARLLCGEGHRDLSKQSEGPWEAGNPGSVDVFLSASRGAKKISSWPETPGVPERKGPGGGVTWVWVRCQAPPGDPALPVPRPPLRVGGCSGLPQGVGVETEAAHPQQMRHPPTPIHQCSQ